MAFKRSAVRFRSAPPVNLWGYFKPAEAYACGLRHNIALVFV